MMKSFLSPQVLNQFLIGFEFEFAISRKVQKTELDDIPGDIWVKYGHLMNKNLVEMTNSTAYKGFLQEMKNHYPQRNWRKICGFREDYTVTSPNNFFGMEIATLPLEGAEAIKILQEICDVLSSPNFKTNDSCGLHFNVSFKENMPRCDIMAFHLSTQLDLYKIANQFGRQTNENCIPNNATEIDRDSFHNAITKSLIKLNQKNGHKISNEEITLQECADIINSLKTMRDINDFKDLTYQHLVAEVGYVWDDNRPAIAPKKSRKKDYLEFRSMGGKDYQKNLPLIKNTIQSFLKEMIKYRQALIKKEKVYN